MKLTVIGVATLAWGITLILAVAATKGTHGADVGEGEVTQHGLIEKAKSLGTLYTRQELAEMPLLNLCVHVRQEEVKMVAQAIWKLEHPHEPGSAWKRPFLEADDTYAESRRAVLYRDGLIQGAYTWLERTLRQLHAPEDQYEYAAALLREKEARKEMKEVKATCNAFANEEDVTGYTADIARRKKAAYGRQAALAQELEELDEYIAETEEHYGIVDWFDIMAMTQQDLTDRMEGRAGVDERVSPPPAPKLRPESPNSAQDPFEPRDDEDLTSGYESYGDENVGGEYLDEDFDDVPRPGPQNMFEPGYGTPSPQEVPRPFTNNNVGTSSQHSGVASSGSPYWDNVLGDTEGRASSAWEGLHPGRPAAPPTHHTSASNVRGAHSPFRHSEYNYGHPSQNNYGHPSAAWDHFGSGAGGFGYNNFENAVPAHAAGGAAVHDWEDLGATFGNNNEYGFDTTGMDPDTIQAILAAQQGGWN